MTRAALAAAVRPFAPNGRLQLSHIPAINALADALGLSGESSGRVTSADGMALIKSFEGLSLKAYPDPGSGGDPWTIGYGATLNVKRGDTITQAEADAFLRRDLARFEKAVNRLAPTTTQGQFDAMVSLAFNVGEGNLSGSTLLRMHNAGDYAGAQGQFARWNRAAGRIMAGLTRRRTAEAAMYGEGR